MLYLVIFLENQQNNLVSEAPGSGDSNRHRWAALVGGSAGVRDGRAMGGGSPGPPGRRWRWHRVTRVGGPM
jgi:hypothetical protein